MQGTYLLRVKCIDNINSSEVKTYYKALNYSTTGQQMANIRNIFKTWLVGTKEYLFYPWIMYRYLIKENLKCIQFISKILN